MLEIWQKWDFVERYLWQPSNEVITILTKHLKYDFKVITVVYGCQKWPSSVHDSSILSQNTLKEKDSAGKMFAIHRRIAEHVFAIKSSHNDNVELIFVIENW